MKNLPPYTKEKQSEPEDSHIFTTSDGEKLRLRFDAIQVYKSDGKNTVVEIGWGDKQSYILDIEFESLDKMILDNRQAWKDYWNNKYSSWD